MDNEEWRDVTVTGGGTHVGSYQVSNLPRVRSLDRIMIRSDGKPLPIAGRVLKPWIDSHGYLKVGLHRDGEVRFVKVARLVLEEFVGPCPPHMQVCHAVGSDPSDCRLEVLRWDTVAANAVDRFGNRPLSDGDIIALREARAAGETVTALGERYDRALESTSRICKGEHYKHVGGPRTFGHRPRGDFKVVQYEEGRQDYATG